MQRSLKVVMGAGLFLFWNLPSKAQTLDWNLDPIKQIHQQQRDWKKQLSSSLKATAPTDNFQVYFRCDPVKNQPTNTINSVWIDGQELTQYDGGYVPLSNLHKQGYEFIDDAGRLYLKNNSRNTSSVVGSLGPKGSCSVGEKSISTVQLNQTIAITTQTGPAASCRSIELNNNTYYSKTAEMTITFKDISENGWKATLKSTVATTLTQNLNECKQAQLSQGK